MKKDMDDVTEKLNVSKDKISSSDEQGNRNVEIIDISVEKISRRILVTSVVSQTALLFKYIKISFTTFYFSTFRRRDFFLFSSKFFRKKSPRF